jgi:hypothetical protein
MFSEMFSMHSGQRRDALWGLALWAMALAPCAVHAAEPRWESVGLFDQAAVSVDMANIDREGAMRKVWSRMDYKSAQKTPQGQTYRSTRTHMEINCQSREMRTLQWSWHAQPRLGGAVVATEGAFKNWQSIPPATPIDRIAKRVC